eukprot:7171_1
MNSNAGYIHWMNSAANKRTSLLKELTILIVMVAYFALHIQGTICPNQLFAVANQNSPNRQVKIQEKEGEIEGETEVLVGKSTTIKKMATNSEEKRSKCCKLSLPNVPTSWKLFVFAVIAVYDIVGDIMLPFSFRRGLQCCRILKCTEGREYVLESICCENEVHHIDLDLSCDEICSIPQQLENSHGEWYNVSVDWAWCQYGNHEHYGPVSRFYGCSERCDLMGASNKYPEVQAMCWVAMIMTVTKEIIKLFYSVQLLWIDHIDSIRFFCDCIKLETLVIWCKDCVLFVLVVILKPSILKDMETVEREYGLDHDKVIFINLLMEDLWGIIASLMIIFTVRATFWSVISLSGNILMIGRQFYVA